MKKAAKRVCPKCKFKNNFVYDFWNFKCSKCGYEEDQELLITL